MRDRVAPFVIKKIQEFLPQRLPIEVDPDMMFIPVRGSIDWCLKLILNDGSYVGIYLPLNHTHFHGQFHYVRMPESNIPIGGDDPLGKYFSEMFARVNHHLSNMHFSITWENFGFAVEECLSSRDVTSDNCITVIKKVRVIPKIQCGTYTSEVIDSVRLRSLLTAAQLNELVEIARREDRDESWIDRPSLF